MNSFPLSIKRSARPVTKRRFGDLKTSIFAYLTPWMLGLIVLVALVVGLNFETVKHNFTSGHVALNGTILAVFFAGVLQACYNNLRLWYVARYLTDLDGYMDIGKITDVEYQELQRRLERSASLINIKTTFDLLDNLYQSGNLLIRDKDAIMLKSKLGYRVRSGRSSVSFLTGILVMFGLIGTFWGLLETIAAVANALNDIAQSSSGDTSAEQMDMGAILGAISTPLKGMSLAFSASLFGLSGSLLLGFFTHLSGDCQNKTIEDVSRWIDDRIPKPDASAAQKGKELKPEGAKEAAKEGADLEAWLATYAYLSRRTEQNLAGLSESFATLIGQIGSLATRIANLDQVQEKTNQLMAASHQNHGIAIRQYEKIASNLAPLPEAMGSMNEALKGTEASLGKMLSHSETVSRQITKSVQDVSAGVGQMAASSNVSAKIQTDQFSYSQSVMETIRQQQEVLSGYHTGLMQEIREMSAARLAERTENTRDRSALEKSIEEQVLISQRTAQNCERLEAAIGNLQETLMAMTASLDGIGDVMKRHEVGILERIDNAVKDLAGHFFNLKQDVSSLKGMPSIPHREKKRSPFYRFRKK